LADNVALPAFTAACCAVAQLLLTASHTAINQYLLAAQPITKSMKYKIIIFMQYSYVSVFIMPS